MAKKYADLGFKFIFVYTREAHPGENYPAHQTLEQKLDHARSLKKVLDVQCPILVDDVEGTGHELYGALPNMTYVIDRGGKVLFRSDWTDPPTIEKVLDYILDAAQVAQGRSEDGTLLRRDGWVPVERLGEAS